MLKQKTYMAVLEGLTSCIVALGLFGAFWGMADCVSEDQQGGWKDFHPHGHQFNRGVKRSSNACRGAKTFLPQLRAAVLLTAALSVSLARIPNVPQAFPRGASSPVGREAARGCGRNPMVEAEPHVFTCEFSGFSG